MIKIFSKAAAPADPEAPHVKRQAAVLGVLNALPAGGSVDFDRVRAALGVSDKVLPDGAIHQIALDAGSRVEIS